MRDWHKKVRDEMQARGWSQAELARRAGVSLDSVYKYLAGNVAQPRGDTRLRLVKALGLTEADLLPNSTVPIVGKAGAGPSGDVVFGEGAGYLGEVQAPPNATSSTVAIEVQGDSMRGVASDGWLIFYDDVRDPPTTDLLGEVCVVGLPDGRVLVKEMHPGRQAGHYDLESANAITMRDVPVRWAAQVTAIIPRRPARLMMRQPR